MHTGVISFCDRVALNIKANDVKTAIVQKLERMYNIKILSKQFNQLDDHGKTYVERFPHWMCLRSNGNPYYMWFTQYQDTNIIFYIDKKVQPGYTLPRIILGRGCFDDRLFTNTLLDGEMVKSKNGGWVFLINDCLAFENKLLDVKPLPERLRLAYRIFRDHYTRHDVIDVCSFAIKQFFACTTKGFEDLQELRTRLPYTNRGIYFWPFSLKYKPKLINFDDSLIKPVVRKVKDNPNFMMQKSPSLASSCSNTDTSNASSSVPSPNRARSPMHGTGDDATISSGLRARPEMGTKEGERLLYLRKTDQPDVYDVFETSDIGQKSIGVACVPNLVTSKMLRASFRGATVATFVPYLCIKDPKFDKWLPLCKPVTVS